MASIVSNLIGLRAIINDTRGLKTLPFNLPPQSIVYCDSGYTDYWAEDEFREQEAISRPIIRKSDFQ